jgi:hypothetical protein
MSRGKTIENILFQQITKPQSFTTSTTVLYNGVAATTISYIDCQGFDEVIIVLNKGTFAATSMASFGVYADDNTDPEAATLVTGASFTDVTASNDDAIEVISVQCKDIGRYVWLKSDKTDDVNTAAVWSATAILCKPGAGPTATTLVKADV